MTLKLIISICCSVCIAWVANAQKKEAPNTLRVDLLQQPEKVYHQGQITGISLEQAVAAGDQWQFCRVNSRFPHFSWVVPEGHQFAYQLLLASRKEWLLNDSADLWNSGLQQSNNSIAVLYKGTALQPATVYYWKVRIWGADRKAGSYSAIQSFCTGKVLEEQGLPSFVLTKTLQLPQQVHRLENNNIRYDFDKDGFCQVKLSVQAKYAGDTLIIHLGEALTADGNINRTPPGSVRYKMIKLPLKQGHHSYQPLIPPDKRNTGSNAILMPADIGEVFPFQYIEIAGAAERYTIDTVSRYLVTSTFDDVATRFTSSDTALNKIWDLCKYTIKATSFSGYYVDGDRERIPYEADALINQLSQYACDAEFTMAKRTLNYLIYHPTWPTEWSLQNALVAWNDYLHSGDVSQVRLLYPELKAKLLTSLARADGLISTRTGKQTPGFLKAIHYQVFNNNTGLKDIVDWPPSGGIGGQQSGVMGETDGFVFTDYNAVVNAWYYAGLQAMTQLAAALQQDADVTYYTREAERVRIAFQRTFFDTETCLVVDGEGTKHSSLHSNFFALAFNLVPKDKIAPVLRFIRSRGMACSVYGAQFLLDALYKANEQEYAQQLITSTGKRSWFNMLREGASMTMEAWGQEYKPNQDWNHAWGTAPANAIVRYVAGVQPLTPGYGEIQIKPQPGTVKQVTLKYRTIRGDISVRFTNGNNSCELQANLPGNTTGHIYLPSATGKATVIMDGKPVKPTYTDGYYYIPQVQPGKHRFQVTANNI